VERLFLCAVAGVFACRFWLFLAICDNFFRFVRQHWFYQTIFLIACPMTSTMISKNFREWTLDSIEEAFGLKQVFQMDLLDELVSFEYAATEFETTYLHKLQAHFHFGGDDWNETELKNKCISPMIVLAETANEHYSYFLEREMVATIGEYNLSGNVDGLIAAGFRNPKQPFFVLAEYKRGTDPNGDPKGQALIAMLVAQRLNENKHPVYGCYVIGRWWYFMVLQGTKYAISKDYSCADSEIFDIFRILKSLKTKIEAIIAQSPQKISQQTSQKTSQQR
jgi:hypothetical protein